MLDIKFIRDNKKLVETNCKNRLVKVDVEKLLDWDTKKRNTETSLDQLRAERNAASKTKPTPEIIKKMKQIGEDIKQAETDLLLAETKVKELIMQVPNLTDEEVLISANEDNNPVLDQFKKPTKFNFEPKDHVQLALDLDLIDFDRATKVSGAKFYYLKNAGALLELALEMYALEIITKHGFTPIITPDLAKTSVLEGLGFNPRGKATQIYNIENTDLSLVGTAEITLGGYHQDEIFEPEQLPKKYVALSHCFRTEAGAYSKFSKGIFRVHQFSKIEMFIYCAPEQSKKFHQELLEIEKEIWQVLDIPFRVIDHCTADLGGPSARTFDLEAWMPGKPNKNNEPGDWAEITSTSNCTDYQARGLNIKYKTADGKKAYVHTLNGTGIAISRAIIAILENYQQKDGSIIIPKVLQKYLGKDKINFQF